MKLFTLIKNKKKAISHSKIKKTRFSIIKFSLIGITFNRKVKELFLLNFYLFMINFNCNRTIVVLN